MTYLDFDLRIARLDDGLRAEVLGSPAGTASADFRLPFSELELENVVLRLAPARRRVRRVESSRMRTAKTFGGSLFKAVFGDAIRSCFQKSLAAARRQGAGLRVRLRLGDTQLSEIPWEYLYDPAVNRFLAHSIHTTLVRYIDLPDPIQPVSVTPPLRALVMISSPTDYPALDVEAEWRRLNQSLRDLVASGHLAIDRLDDASLPALQRALRRSRYHIFHFIGHGEFDQALQEGVLVFERKGERDTRQGAEPGDRVPSQYLGTLLHDHQSLRVAVLNSCEGARTSRLDPFAGAAQTLVQQGIPAVIAMQFEIADEVASTFAHEFYEALADGYPIDAAVAEARKAIFLSGGDVEWGTPVLYLRASDARIFDVRGRTSAEASAGAAGRTRAVRTPEEGTKRVVRVRGADAPIRAADIALANGRLAEAIEHLARARRADPRDPRLATLTARAEEQRAVATARAARRGSRQTHLAAARDLLDKGDAAGAAHRIQLALVIEPDDAEALALEKAIRQAAGTPGNAGESPPKTQAGGRAAAVTKSRPGRRPTRPPAFDGERDLLD